jgi:hypothetical protein
MTKRYDISKPRKYVKDGVEKTYWDRVGEMVEFEKQGGSVSRIIKIPAIGLEANVFPVKPREQATPTVAKDDLPFDSERASDIPW